MGRRGTFTIAPLLLLASAALAGDPGSAVAAELVLEAPTACFTLDELAFRAERLLGQPLANVDAMQLALRVESQAKGFVARLEVARPGDAERGVRSLRAASCAELVESLAIAIVVAIGDVQTPPEPAPEPSAPPPALPTRSAAIAAEFAAPQEAGKGPTLAGAAWAIADSGTLPASTLGVGVGLGLSWRSLELRAIGTLLPEREGTLVTSDPGSPGVSIGLLAGGAVGCVPVALRSSSLEMALCAGAELGQLSGSGTGVLVPYQRRTLWAAARVELATRLALFHSPLSLELLATALAPFTRDEFFLKDLGEVHRPASMVGRLGLGLSLAVDGARPLNNEPSPRTPRHSEQSGGEQTVAWQEGAWLSFAPKAAARRPISEQGSTDAAPEAPTSLPGPLLSFELIYREHFDFACRSLRLLGVERDGLEDAAQDVFGIASRRLAEFEGTSSVKTWIFAIVQRVAANHRRTHRRKQAPLEPLTPEFAVGPGPSPESEAEAAQSAALIRAFSDSLDEGRRALLVLGLIEGVPMRELADTLGIPLQTAYSRVRALRRSLELHLLQHEAEHG